MTSLVEDLKVMQGPNPTHVIFGEKKDINE